MWSRRILYLASLLFCLVFDVFYKEWMAWILLLSVAGLPWLSLLMSMPAMLTVKAQLRCPQSVRMGVPARTGLKLECKFPQPPVSCKIRLHHSLTDSVFVGQPGELIPTDHCGVMSISYDRLQIYDYLCLFRRNLKRPDKTEVYIEPKPIPTREVLHFSGKSVSLWRPKPGGGFSENHDLRPYRPGDDLRNIHWKMTAKTGKLIYREPIEPVQQGYLLSVTLMGSGDEIDRKLGRLVWASSQLLMKQQEHTVRCQTGNGELSFTVAEQQELELAMQMILQGPPATEEADAAQANVLWQHHIGGDGDEDR